jgi:probable phosphoglycerate mutase
MGNGGDHDATPTRASGDSGDVTRLFVLARHGESTLNASRVVNGDPAVDVPLTEQGRRESELLGEQLRNVPLDICLVTRFARTRETADIALRGRDVPIEVEPLFDDVDVGGLEGLSLDEYRAWKARHNRSDAFPGGESLDDAAVRYGRALEAVLTLRERAVLVVAHEIPVRYALNASEHSPDLDAPHHAIANATPYLFGEDRLREAAAWLAGRGSGAALDASRTPA